MSTSKKHFCWEISRRGIHGLGVAWEFTSLQDDEAEYAWIECTLRLFFAVWMVSFDFPVSGKKKILYDNSGGELERPSQGFVPLVIAYAVLILVLVVLAWLL